MASFWIFVATSSLLTATSAQSNILPISLASTTPPQDVSPYISPSFAGFGIEPSNLFSFTGQDTVNTLSVNLLENLANYTGTPPHLRIGGNTEDYMIFQSDMTQWTWINNPNPTGQGVYASDSMIIGPKFFEAANRFPKGTPVTWGLNMAYEEPDYIDRIVTMADQVVKNTPNLNLVSFEIGNEPDLYLQNQFRSAPWNGQVYTGQWLDRAQAIWSQVLEPNNLPSNFFEPACTASTIGTDFMIEDLMTFDINEQANDSSHPYIASWNQHDYYYYIGVSTYPLTLYHFMTLSTTADQFAAWVTQIQQAEKTPYPYALREMGVVGPIGMAGITDVFAAALWTLNFFLYAATLNITSVQMHMTDNSNASAWAPIPVYGEQPHVRPNYYGFAAFDQIIGPSCQAQISQLSLNAPGNYGGRVEAYSVYQAGQLSSIVVINSNLANVSDTDKASLTVQLSLPSSLAGETLHLAYLTNDGADALANTTWNGISFEQNSEGIPAVVNNTDATVKIGSDGSATFLVRDTQAIVAQIGSRVGSIKADSAACSSLAQRSQGSGSTSTGSSASTTSSSAGSSVKASGSSTSTSTAKNGVLRLTTFVSSWVGVALVSAILMLWT